MTLDAWLLDRFVLWVIGHALAHKKWHFAARCVQGFFFDAAHSLY